MEDRKRVFVVGVGMTKFIKPSEKNPDYPQLAATAVNRALRDCGLSYAKVQAAAVGYVYGDSTCGQRALYQVGMSGIPIYNLNNNCSTGSSAIHLAAGLVGGGLFDCVLALGFEKMERGSLSAKYMDRTNPLDKIFTRTNELTTFSKAPFAPQFFGNAGIWHMQKYGTKPEHFAKVAAKNHKHSLNNPYSQFQDGHSVEAVLKSAPIHAPLTKLQCCPTSDGAGAVVICSEAKVKQLGLEDQAVQILAIEMATDRKEFTDNLLTLVGYGMSKEAAEKAYRKAGVKPQDVSVVELHDCFSANQLITYEALSLCPEGKAAQFIDKGLNTYGGKVVVNPSGGLISKGHPLGATGLAQCCELNWQLRGIADKRQVPNAQIALQHNIGLGGACVVAIYKKLKPGKSKGTSDLASIESAEKQISRATL